jgi:hypothetical protein
VKRKKKLRINGKSILRILFFFIFSAILFGLLCGIGAGYFFLATKLHGFSLPETYTYRVGMDSTKINGLKKYYYKVGELDGTKELYVNFTAMLDFCGFYESGDGEEFRYILPSDGSQFIVTDGSTRVDINGNIIYMDAPAIYSEGKMYLPLTFIDRYIEGITVTVSTKQVKVTDEDGEHEELKTVEIPNSYDIRFHDKKEFHLILEPVKPTPPVDISEIE